MRWKTGRVPVTIIPSPCEIPSDECDHQSKNLYALDTQTVTLSYIGETPTFIVSSLWDTLKYSVRYHHEKVIIPNLEPNYAQKVALFAELNSLNRKHLSKISYHQAWDRYLSKNTRLPANLRSWTALTTSHRMTLEGYEGSTHQGI